MNRVESSDYSIKYFIHELNKIFENEIYKYSFHDFERVKLNEKNKLFNLLERIQNINNKKTTTCANKLELEYIYKDLNSKLEKYEIINIGNIKCGRILKYKERSDIPIQLYEGYYYSFTLSYKKKDQ